MKIRASLLILSAVPLAAPAQVLSSAPRVSSGPVTTTSTSPAPGLQPPAAPTRPPSLGESNPALPLPGTANPGVLGAPMVPNPMPAPGAAGAPSAGSVSQAPLMRTERQEESQERRRERQDLRAIRDAVMRRPTAGPTGMNLGPAVRDLDVVRKNGKVVLTGVVATQAEKDAAGARASQAAGGKEIVNQITVGAAKP
ncbi:MAG: BON domain-containing protein [Elusimicrobia bacterium]|nr:BON domain-containing protein [Elusimicrobiota bacterium]